jgi:hypothetical protein
MNLKSSMTKQRLEYRAYLKMINIQVRLRGRRRNVPRQPKRGDQPHVLVVVLAQRGPSKCLPIDHFTSFLSLSSSHQSSTSLRHSSLIRYGVLAMYNDDVRHSATYKTCTVGSNVPAKVHEAEHNCPSVRGRYSELLLPLPYASCRLQTARIISVNMTLRVIIRWLPDAQIRVRTKLTCCCLHIVSTLQRFDYEVICALVKHPR